MLIQGGLLCVGDKVGAHFWFLFRLLNRFPGNGQASNIIRPNTTSHHPFEQ